MNARIVRIYFDFIDPLSRVASHVLRQGAAAAGAGPPTIIEWIGFELRPPPTPLTTVDDPFWEARLRAARPLAEEYGLGLAPPRLVPWSRKAHELHTLAGERGVGAAVRADLFEAYFGRSSDIGRVDVLVEVAAAAGLDRTETKAVLDVDRHEGDVLAVRAEAERMGVADVPSAWIGGRRVQGFPNLTDLGTLLPHS
jgi:predicted DsbA family dithiol-disulfide isomerase